MFVIILIKCTVSKFNLDRQTHDSCFYTILLTFIIYDSVAIRAPVCFIVAMVFTVVRMNQSSTIWQPVILILVSYWSIAIIGDASTNAAWSILGSEMAELGIVAPSASSRATLSNSPEASVCVAPTFIQDRSSFVAFQTRYFGSTSEAPYLDMFPFSRFCLLERRENTLKNGLFSLRWIFLLRIRSQSVFPGRTVMGTRSEHTNTDKRLTHSLTRENKSASNTFATPRAYLIASRIKNTSVTTLTHKYQKHGFRVSPSLLRWDALVLASSYAYAMILFYVCWMWYS